MFGTFFLWIVIGYVFYYVGMIGMDLYAADKAGCDDTSYNEVDISGTAGGYVPKDVRNLLDDSSDKTSTENSSKQSLDTPTAGAGDGPAMVRTDFQSEYNADSWAEIFKQEAQTPSIFAGVNMSAI